MNLIREYVSTMSYDHLRQVLIDNERFEAIGVMGNTVARYHVESLMAKAQSSAVMQMWLTLLVQEIWRRLCLEREPELVQQLEMAANG